LGVGVVVGYNQIFVGTPELEVEGDPFSQQRELAAALQVRS
jgi:hypothetical protein